MHEISPSDRFKIQDLFAAYSWALDTGDADALVTCFTADCLMKEEVFEDPDIWHGHDGIRGLLAHYGNSPGFPGRQHHATQLQLTAQTPDLIHARSFAFVTECEDEPPYLLRFAGWYQDKIVREHDGQWRFAERIVRLWDGEVLQRFPGRGQWVARKRPPALMKR